MGISNFKEIRKGTFRIINLKYDLNLSWMRHVQQELILCCSRKRVSCSAGISTLR